MTRRRFLGASATAGAGLALLGPLGPTACTTVSKWKDLVTWDHSWDALDAVTYLDDGTAYSMPAATRVAVIPDPAGARPMLRDTGAYQGLFGMPAAPGPLWTANDSRFGGRPSWFSDTILEAVTYFDNFHSMLSPLTDKGDTAQWFRWAQPWWGCMLVHRTPDVTGHESVYLDGDPGMATIGADAELNISCWNGVYNPGPYLRLGQVPAGAQLVQWTVNHESSFFEVTSRGLDGQPVTAYATGPLGGNLLNTLHSGWSHTNITSAIGLARGVPTAAQLVAVRNWALPYIPTPV